MKNYKITETESGSVKVELDLDEERKELLKIYKENALIKGYAEKRALSLTALDFKLFNLICKFVQDEVRVWGKNSDERAKTTPPKKHMGLEINQNVIAELLELNKDKYNNWKRDIEKSLTRLSNESFILRNYIDRDLGHLEFYKVNLIAFPKLKKIDDTGKNDILSVFVPDVIVLSCWRQQKYTPLVLNNINKLNSKYALRLYEYIEMIKNYKQNKGENEVKYLDISFEELRFIFNKPKAKYISMLFQNVRFDEIVMPELNKILNCDYEIFAKDKKITLNFTKSFETKAEKENKYSLNLV